MQISPYSILCSIFIYSRVSVAAPTGFDPSSEASVKQALQSMAGDLMQYYTSNNYEGSVTENSVSRGVDGFQWFEGGIFWGIMMEYVRTTGDSKYDSTMFTALATASNGAAGSFLGPVPSLAALAGKWNDDILWWAMGPTTGGLVYGASTGLPGGVSLQALSSNTWNEVWGSQDDKCGGGIYWSRNQAKSAGYKSTIANVQEMLVGAQLTAMTGNQSYVENSGKIYSWLKSSKIVTSDWKVYDGIDAEKSCTISQALYSYSPGILLAALGWMYKTTNQPSYLSESSSLLTASLAAFAPNSILTDSCEPNCALNSVSFKGAFARGLGYLYEMTSDQAAKTQIKNVLSRSITAMLNSCDQSWNCGINWASSTPNPGGKSVHDQMVAMELMTAYYKTFGISMKSGLTPPAGAAPAGSNGGVGSIPKGDAQGMPGGRQVLMGSLLAACLGLFVLYF